MKRSKIFSLVVVCSIFVWVMTSFSAISTAEAEETLKIGVIAPLSGLFSATGEPTYKGAQLAAKMINEQGGILGKKVEILARDSEARPATGIRMARELNKEHGVKFFAGVVSSGVALALKPVMEEMNTLLVVCAAHSTEITGKQWSKNIFRICDEARTRNYALADIIHSKFPLVKRWANISPDYAYGHSCWENFAEKIKQLNPKTEIVADRWPKFGAGGGYGSHISAIMAANPEGVYSVLYGGDMIAFLREGKQWGLFEKVKVFACSHLTFNIPYIMKKEMPNIWTSEHYFAPAYKYPLTKTYEAAFKVAFGEKYFLENQGHATSGFDTVYTYKAAVEKAKTFEMSKVLEAMEDLTIDSPLGKKWIRAGDHQAYFDIPYYNIVPDTNSELGWKVNWYTTIDGKKHMIPVEEALRR